MRLFLFVCLFLLAAVPLRAERIPSHCLAFASQYPGVEVVALGGMADLETDHVRLHFIGHSTYLLETEGGLTVATDYTGFVGGDLLPDVVTMNRAHSSHYTNFPDPAIPHVLKGWGSGTQPADHYLELDEILIRNVTTDIRSRDGGSVKDGNSIFIFEVGGLCIGHLGHIHHEPSDEHYALLGRMDVVMVPVDGGRTLDTASMIRVMKRLKARVVLPMHWFGDGTLEFFLNGMRDEFEIDYTKGNSIDVSLRDLPRTPTIYVLRPRPIPN